MSRRKLVVKSNMFGSYSAAADVPFRNLSEDHPNIKLGALNSDDLMRWKYLFIFANSMIGFFLMILDLQVAWDGTELVWSKGVRSLRFVITFLTLILILQLLDYYNGILSIKTRVWKTTRFTMGFNISAWSVIQSSLVAPLFWGEVLVCLLHAPPIPGIDDKVGLLMFMRFYMVFRIIKDHSTIYKYRNTIIKRYSKYGGKSWGPPRFSWSIATKTLFYRHPFIFISSVTLFTLWTCGHLIYVFEREVQPDIFSYHGSLYLSLISMITGWPTDTYEEYNPETRFGRMACIMSTMVGLYLLTLMLEVLTNFAVATPHQRPAMIWAHRQEIKVQLRDSAARIIQIVWRRHCQRKGRFFKSEMTRCTYRPTLGARYVQAAKDFRNLMRQKIALQIRLDEAQAKDIDADEPPPAPYSEDDDYSYAHENNVPEVEERLKAMETLIQNLTLKIDALVKSPSNKNVENSSNAF